MKERQEVSKGKKILVIVLSILLFGSMGTGFYLSRLENSSIDNNLAITKGIIIDKYSQNSRGESCKYEFSVNGKKYEGHESLGKIVAHIGDTVNIEYSEIKPDYNRISFGIKKEETGANKPQ